MRDIPQIYLDFIGRVEGDRLTAYQDQGGTWTVGKGHTGPEVHEGMTISEEESNHLCVADSHHAMVELYDAADTVRLERLDDHQFSALLSFVYNLGADPKWTIWKDIDTGNLADVPTQLLRFDKIRDRKTGVAETVPGLIHRRMAERALWETPDVAAAGKIIDASPVPPPPSSYTREAATPPAPALPAVPSVMSRTKWAAGGIAILGLATSAQTFMQGAKTSIDGAGFGGPLVAGFDHYAGVIIAGLAVAITIIRSLDEQLKSL